MIDLEAKAKTRIYSQYKNAPKFEKWVTIMPRVLKENIQKPSDFLLDSLDIDKMRGARLDVIGEIVGQDRPNINKAIIADEYFGWGDTQGSWGALWYSPELALGDVIPLPDPFYRILIRAKIMKNNGDGTIDNIDDAVEFITGATATVTDNLDMTFNVTFTSTPDSTMILMLQNFDLLPRPMGVRFTNFTTPSEEVYFGYVGDPQATPYGVASYKDYG